MVSARTRETNSAAPPAAGPDCSTRLRESIMFRAVSSAVRRSIRPTRVSKSCRREHGVEEEKGGTVGADGAVGKALDIPEQTL